LNAPPRVWDDHRIPNEETLYRRVPDLAEMFGQVRDLVSGRALLSRAALRFDEDGMSVFREELLRLHKLSIDLMKRRDNDQVFSFPVEIVRQNRCGVVDDPDEHDKEIGVAHALVKGETDDKPEPKAGRNEIVDAICRQARRVI
jgi:hypothetical protein